jgi:alpha-galactosidase
MNEEISARPLFIAACLCLALSANAATRGDREVHERSLRGGEIRIDFDDHLRSRVVALLGGIELPLGPFSASESVVVGGAVIEDFPFARRADQRVHDVLGAGRRLRITGETPTLTKIVTVSVYDAFPRMAVVQTAYTNRGPGDVAVEGWTSVSHVLAAADGSEPAFWSFESGSYESRPDWVLPVPLGFDQENFLGMNASDYGGGTPVVDVWRRDAGLAVGHLETSPRLVSLPLSRTSPAGVTIGVTAREPRRLRPGEGFETLRTFVAVHRRDHFQTLSTYRALMARQGLESPPAPRSAFEPIWCAWGYGRSFTPAQVIETLPTAKRLGFGWATLDDGWQVAEGDWVPAPAKFPKGDADMKGLVDRIHDQGLKAQLWWTPLAVDPGTPLHKNHPDQLLLGAEGGTRAITWWDSLYLCPAYAPVRADAAAFARKAIAEWGFDGLKIDGQHLNGAPPCYNPAHHHASPQESVAGVPGFFKAVFDAATSARPEAVVEICPCGTAYSFFMLPYLNMAVASDPTSSWQVRLKGKTLKALMGDKTAYFGDHVELSDGGVDFASTLGIGGVIGTQFAWPGAPGAKDPKLLLDPERERAWELWTRLYREKRLYSGEYLGGLYDIGFDRPEAHAIRKDGVLYYAFYAPAWKGPLSLRGLSPGRYRVRDYEAGKDIGDVVGPEGTLAADFRGHLLIEARPK